MTSTGDLPNAFHGTLRVSLPRRPALTLIGRLRCSRASGFSWRLWRTTLPAKTEILFVVLWGEGRESVCEEGVGEREKKIGMGLEWWCEYVCVCSCFT